MAAVAPPDLSALDIDASEAACWAHVRRKFFDIEQAYASPLAEEALKRIGELYAIESEIRGRSPDEREIRQARSVPLIAGLHEWMQQTLTKVSRKSDITGAISYALGRWPALSRYCDDGLLEIDNNAGERALRAVAIGRKNYLFRWFDPGGRARRGDLQLNRFCETEWAGSGSLLARCVNAHC